MRALAASTLLLLLAAAPDAPTLRRERGRLVLAAMPDLLSVPEVAAHLESGLTTSFLFQVTARDGGGGKVSGGGLVEIRYELWDEAYVVVKRGSTGPPQQVRFESRRHLDGWWRRLELPLTAAGGLDRGRSWRVRLELAVVPFSSAEQRDAQRWLSRSLDATGEGSAAATSEATEEPPLAFTDLLNLLMATSIQRPALTSYEWTLSVPPEAPP